MKYAMTMILAVITLSASADTSLVDAVRGVTATVEARMVPRDWQCFQPGVVLWVSATLQWQQARIAELERQLAERR